MGEDHPVDVAPLGGHVGIREGVLVLVEETGPLGCRIVGRCEFLAVEDVHGSLAAHDRDLGGGPGEVDVGPEVL